MKLIVIKNGEGPEMRDAQAIADDFSNDGKDVEIIEWESDEATSLARLYDIYSTPAFIVTGDDGSQIEQWQGSQLPLVSEIKHLM